MVGAMRTVSSVSLIECCYQPDASAVTGPDALAIGHAHTVAHVQVHSATAEVALVVVWGLEPCGWVGRVAVNGVARVTCVPSHRNCG